MDRHRYKRVYSEKYYRIIYRFVRQIERETTKLQKEHPSMGVADSWRIVKEAYKVAERSTKWWL